MLLNRTDKQFSQDNMPIEFIRKALSIAGNHNLPNSHLVLPDEFIVVTNYGGRRPGGFVIPWKDEYEEHYTKYISSVYLSFKGFDTLAIIYDDGMLNSYYFKDGKKEPVIENIRKTGPTYNPISWVNLLFDFGFLEDISK